VAACWLSAAPAGAVGGWTAAQTLTAPGESLSFVGGLAADATGNVRVSWIRTLGLGSKPQVVLSARPPGGPFAPNDVLTPATGSAQASSVAYDSAGNGIEAWVENGTVEVAEAPAGSGFGPPKELSTGSESALGAQVIFDSGGDAIVLWEDSSFATPNETRSIEVRARPAGGTFGEIHQLETHTHNITEGETATLGPELLAVDGKGNTYVVWNPELSTSSPIDTHTSSIKIATRTHGGSFGTPTTLEQKFTLGGEVELVNSPAIAADEQGDAIVAWDLAGPKGGSAEAKLQPAGGPFEAKSEAVPAGPEGAVFSPHIAFDHARTAVVLVNGKVGAATSGTLVTTRAVGGEFSKPKPLTELGVQTNEDTITTLAGGEVLAAWARYAEPGYIEAASRPPGGTFGAPVEISPSDKQAYTTNIRLTADGLGDGIATWRHFGTSQTNLEWAAFDHAPPSLAGASIPEHAVAGVPVLFSASPLDAFSALEPSSWGFGDGGAASGSSVSHAYAAPGTYTVTLKSSDVLGNAASVTGTVSVAAPPPSPPPGGAGAGAPVLSGVGQSHAKWRGGTRAASFARTAKVPVGTTFRLALNEATGVSFTFKRVLAGRKVGRRCVAQTVKNRHRRSCTRTISAGALTFAGHPGANALTFQGKLSAGKRLVPGRYTVTILATNSRGQRSAGSTLGFTIVR
jgi:hypothetical protein